MGAKNTYLDNRVPLLYRKSILDVMIYTFIDAQRFTIASISIEESAISFMKHYDVSEDELTLDKVITTFKRIQRDLLDEQKTDHKKTN